VKSWPGRKWPQVLPIFELASGTSTPARRPSQTTGFFASIDSFALTRGGHVDPTNLGAIQVARNDDFANGMIPGRMFKGKGGAMNPVAGVKRIVVVMEHSAKDGPKLLTHCNLPLAGAKVEELVIANLAVFEIDEHGLRGTELKELAPGVTLDEVAKKTEATYRVTMRELRAPFGTSFQKRRQRRCSRAAPANDKWKEWPLSAFRFYLFGIPFTPTSSPYTNVSRNVSRAGTRMRLSGARMFP
jgi:3-oxoacid CoA-transferase B subunit